MTTPIPLADPSGTVRAWACGECGRVDRSWPVAAQLDCTIEDAARESKRLASMCCVRCPACRQRWSHPGVCLDCERRGRRAFGVLACIGVAVAAKWHAIAVGNVVWIEADRLRHGVPVEGDFVCPNEMEVRDLRAALVRYGRHAPSCPMCPVFAVETPACSCGLQERLDAAKGGAK